MYSYPITPEQLKVMWEALKYIVEYEWPFEQDVETYEALHEYFEEE